MKKKKIIIFLVLLLLVLAGAAGAYYYFYYLPGQEEREGTNPPADEGQAPIEYNGQYVSGEAPEGWTITEYQNGAGSDMLVSGVTYIGLTGVEVKNPSNTVVFKLEGVYGIGGTDACMSYFRFGDDSTAYYNSVVATNAEVGETAPAVTNLTASTYQEYEIFGVRIRRVGNAIYWDRTAGDAYFQAACGINFRIFNFTTPTFTGGPETINDYQFTLSETSPESELLELDEILQSLTIL